MEKFCLYQCPDHHGVNVHTVDCPVHLDRPVCAGDDYGMYGDGE